MRKNKRPVTAFAKKSCVTATQVALAMMAAPLVYAQQAEVQKGERIEITGTRIPSPNLESTSPVAVIGAEDIKFEGVRNVENLLNNMPQVFATQGASISNGATGTATVDLRGLGSVRTLVLVNGKRMPPGSPRTWAPDLNQIPAPLIQRVEILSGGASSVYGSDAISGVVNFILRDNFEGVQGEVNYSWYQHDQHNPQDVQAILSGRAARNPAQFQIPGDKGSLGESTEASLVLGGNFAGGKGNATLYWGYKKDQAVLQKDYDYSECSFNSSATGFGCGGSSTSFPGRFIALTGPNAGRSFTIADAAGTVRPFAAATDQFNFAPYNYYQRPSERYTFHASGHYDINPHVRAYLDFGFHDDHTIAQIAPSGLFGVDVILNGDNPLLSPSFRSAFGLTNSPTSTAELLIFRRNIEGGGRQDDIRHTSFRAVGGVKGDIFKNWDYDIYAQTGKVIYQEIYRNDFSISRGGLALDVVTNPATGLPICRSELTGSTAQTPILLGCVPYNIFQLGGVNAGSLAYLSTPGLQRGSTSQAIQGATLTGDLGNYGWRFPSAKTGIGLAVGVERRVEKLELDTDTAFTTGDLAGQGGPTLGVAGQYTVKEAFGEVRIPVIEGRHMAQLLSINASYRYSDYSTGFTTDTYGIGADFAPVQAVKFRGSYQQASRAPNVIELFTPQGIGLFNLDVDPCAGPTPSATAAQCARTGLPANLYGQELLTNPAGQYNALFGGNPNLQPEKSKSYTAGIVLQPLRNLSGTVDYFRIKVDNVISALDPNIALTQCLTSGQFCDLIHRDRIGTLWATPSGFITSTNINLSKLQTSGYDVSVNYNYPIGRWGGLGFNLLGTYLHELKTEPIPGLGEYNCVKFYGGACGTPNPEWRHRFRVTWNTPWNLDAALTWRHLGKVDYSGLSDNPLLAASSNPVDQHLGERDYIDLAASWAFSKTITIRGGVNNIMDRDPPISSLVGAGFGNGNTFPQVYDALGRKFFAAVTVRY